MEKDAKMLKCWKGWFWLVNGMQSNCLLVCTERQIQDLLIFGNLVTEKDYYSPKNTKTASLKYNMSTMTSKLHWQLSTASQNTQQLSRGEICGANFIPPANGASQGNYFLPKSHKLAYYWVQIWPQTDRQTDRQKYSLAPYTGVCRFFLSVKFATSCLGVRLHIPTTNGHGTNLPISNSSEPKEVTYASLIQRGTY